MNGIKSNTLMLHIAHFLSVYCLIVAFYSFCKSPLLHFFGLWETPWSALGFSHVSVELGVQVTPDGGVALGHVGIQLIVQFLCRHAWPPATPATTTATSATPLEPLAPSVTPSSSATSPVKVTWLTTEWQFAHQVWRVSKSSIWTKV